MNFIEAITGKEVVSFDVFDTLIFRKVYEPKSIFHVMVSVFENRYKKPIGFDFVKLRQMCEVGAGRFEDIYNNMRNCGIPTDFSKVLSNIELEVERKFCVRNEEMFQLYVNCMERGLKVIATSDMYLSNNFIKEILYEKGYTFDQVFVSSDGFGSKHNGQIFSNISNLLKCPYSKILHIGDNAHSDVIVPKELGIEAVYYDKSNEVRNTLFENKFILSKPSTAYQIYLGLNAMKYYPDIWYRFGYSILALCIIGFIGHLIQHIKENKIDKVYFLLRDSFVIKEAYDILSKVISLPESEMLYISRKLYKTNSQDYREYITKTISQKNIVVVDVGWMCNSQKYIQEICKNTNVSGVYLATFEEAGPNTYGYLFNRINQYIPVPFFESFFIAPCPIETFIDVKKTENGYAFISEDKTISGLSLKERMSILEGVKDFTRDFSEYVALDIFPTKKEVSYLLYKLVQYPSCEEVQAWKDVSIVIPFWLMWEAGGITTPWFTKETIEKINKMIWEVPTFA